MLEPPEYPEYPLVPWKPWAPIGPIAHERAAVLEVYAPLVGMSVNPGIHLKELLSPFVVQINIQLLLGLHVEF